MAYFNLLRSEALEKARARLRDRTAAKDTTDDHRLTEAGQQTSQRFSVRSLPETAGEREISSSDNRENPRPGIGIRD